MEKPLSNQDMLKLVPGNAPVGLGGCRAKGNHLEQCDYNLTVFDGGGADEYHGPVRVSHAKLSYMRPEAAVHYLDMQVLRDDSWKLHTTLAALQPERILPAYMRDRAVEAALCCTRSDGEDGWRVAMWTKAAALHLYEAVMATSGKRPSPTHGLTALHKGHGLAVHQELGLERASPTLLSRMCESVIGIAESADIGLPPDAVRAKRKAMVSRPAACYLYLASLAWRLLSCHPPSDGMEHLVRTAMDLDKASSGAADRLRHACTQILGPIGSDKTARDRTR